MSQLQQALLALLQEQRLSEAKDQEIRRLRTGLYESIRVLDALENTREMPWYDAHTTLLEHLQLLMDPGPQARGERPLLEVSA